MKKNKILLLLVFFFSFFLFQNNVLAHVDYADIQFDDTNPVFYNVFYYLTNGLDNDVDSNPNKKFAYNISEKGSGLLTYYTTFFSQINSTFKPSDFKAIGFGNRGTLELSLTDNVYQNFKKEILQNFDDYGAKYFVVLYRDVYITRNSNKSKYYINCSSHGPIVLYYDENLEYLGFYRNAWSVSSSGMTLFEVDYSLLDNISGDFTHTKNNDITLLLNLVYQRSSGYRIACGTGFASDDRAIIESVYYENRRYELASSSLYGFGGWLWNFAQFWNVGDALISSVSSSALIKYRKNPIMSKSQGYITPFEALYDIDMDNLEDIPPSSYASVDISLDKNGYYFVPISNTDFEPPQVNFYFIRTEKGSSLVASTLEYSSGTLQRNSMYLSYAFTKSTLGAHKYFKISGNDFMRDVNLSTGKEDRVFNYKGNVVFMYTDFLNSSTFVYYDSSKYQVYSASQLSSGSVAIYGNKYNVSTSNTYKDVDKAFHDFVGYDGDIYELGSVQWNGVLDNGYDNWKDCVDNDCIESNEDWADPDTWGFNSLDDIIKNAWAGISGLLDSVSAVVAMFNTLFTGLPPLISSTFQIIFVTSMVLILLKILL